MDVYKVVRHKRPSELCLEVGNPNSNVISNKGREATTVFRVNGEENEHDCVYLTINHRWFRTHISSRIGLITDCYIGEATENRLFKLIDEQVGGVGDGEEHLAGSAPENNGVQKMTETDKESGEVEEEWADAQSRFATPITTQREEWEERSRRGRLQSIGASSNITIGEDDSEKATADNTDDEVVEGTDPGAMQ